MTMAKTNAAGRTVRGKKSKLTKDQHFVQLFKYILEEPAWLQLSMGARCLYVALRSYFNGHNNGQIFLSVREAARQLNCSPSSTARYFKELQEKGFIKQANPGRLGVDGHGLATCWILTEIGYDGNRPTKDFKRLV